MEQKFTMASPREYRRYWLPELLIWLAVAILGTALFWLRPLDLEIAREFFVFAGHGSSEHWPHGDAQPWKFFYHAAPILIGIVAVLAVGAIIWGSLRAEKRMLRLYGLYILLSIAIGPGLIVNTVLKDHFGRPRPRNIVEFGGKAEYLPPLQPGVQGMGKSFPCGHCSVGFVLVAFYFLLRRRKPWPSLAVLTAVMAFGALLGIGRIAGGAHFASDVLWAGLVTFGVCWTLYYFVLNIPAREDAFATGRVAGVTRPRLVIAASVLLGLTIIAGVMLATPQQAEFNQRVQADVPFWKINLEAEVADLEITLVPWKPSLFSGASGPTNAPKLEHGTLSQMQDLPSTNRRQEYQRLNQPMFNSLRNSHILSGANKIEITGWARGFGAPGSRVEARGQKQEAGFAYTYQVTESGFFTDLDVVLRAVIAVHDLEKLRVRINRGSVVVRGAIPEDPAVLDIQVQHGKVELIEEEIPQDETSPVPAP